MTQKLTRRTALGGFAAGIAALLAVGGLEPAAAAASLPSPATFQRGGAVPARIAPVNRTMVPAGARQMAAAAVPALLELMRARRREWPGNLLQVRRHLPAIVQTEVVAAVAEHHPASYAAAAGDEVLDGFDEAVVEYLRGLGEEALADFYHEWAAHTDDRATVAVA